jgi:hypothetical protein
MKRIKQSYIIFNFTLLGLFYSSNAFAQFLPCVDSTRIQPFYQCNDPIFDPVCGCDGNTYRNVCQAFNQFGVNTWQGGVCRGFYLDVFPNPVDAFAILNFRYQFEFSSLQTMQIRIIDNFGKPMLQQNFQALNKNERQLDLSGFPGGFYYLIAISGNGELQVRKFFKQHT